jgi:hypothetical protein
VRLYLVPDACVNSYSLVSIYDNGYKHQNYSTLNCSSITSSIAPFWCGNEQIGKCSICKPILCKITLVLSGESQKNHKTDGSSIVCYHLLVLFPLWRMYVFSCFPVFINTLKLEMQWENMFHVTCFVPYHCCNPTPVVRTCPRNIALRIKFETGWVLCTHGYQG